MAEPTRVIPLIVVLFMALVVAPILLSNVLRIEGPLTGGTLELEYDGGVLSLHNATPTRYVINLTNHVDRTVLFNLSLAFFFTGIVHGGFTVLDFYWTLNSSGTGLVYLNDTPEPCPDCAYDNVSWHDTVPDAVAPLGIRTYEVTVILTFIGAGSYALVVSALRRAA